MKQFMKLPLLKCRTTVNYEWNNINTYFNYYNNS